MVLSTYLRGLEMPRGHVYRWSNKRRSRSGHFRITWDFPVNGSICKDFEAENHINGHRSVHQGTACREADGNWHFH